MRPKEPGGSDDPALFRSRLENIIDPHHPLVRLAKLIDWDRFDATVLHGSTWWAHGALRAVRAHSMRTYSGRPRSSMWFSTPTAMATSVACRPSVCERSVSPITRL